MADADELKQSWTPLKIIQWAVPFLSQKGIPHPRFDAETLIASALKIDRLKVYLQFDRPLDAAELALIREMMRRRSRMEPIQYITGQREFYGLPFKVSPAVLIPRPETELLVELALEYLKNLPEEKRLVLDLGTGSGCIALSLAQNIPCQVWAVDISKPALEVAIENAHHLGIEGILWREGDWFSALKGSDPQRFQLIISNPPYIGWNERGDLSPEVRDFEPPEALFSGDNGLKAYGEIAQDLDGKLNPDGMALFELQANQSDNIKALFEGGPWLESLHQDLQGLPRVLMLKKSTIY